jgi:hypothetical protein
MMLTLATPPANAAARQECQHHVIAWADPFNLRTCSLDNTGGFMTEHHGLHRDAPLSTHDVIISATETDCCDTDKQLGGAGLIELNALDR